jgi:hypothetical protein
MTAIWKNEANVWELATPEGFPAEAKLHDLVEDAPQVLPLAGAPRLVMLGREVPCGSGMADLVAIERTGRLVLIEVKLAASAEARRAVVAQLLSYAAALRGTSVAQLDNLLSAHLPPDHDTVVAAVGGADQEGEFDAAALETALAECLASGRFRLVFVLDSAPDDLVRLVGYLEDLTDEALVIDLVTVAEYKVGDSRILVPQRLDPGRQPTLGAKRPVYPLRNQSPRKGSRHSVPPSQKTPPKVRQLLPDSPNGHRHWSATGWSDFSRPAARPGPRSCPG